MTQIVQPPVSSGTGAVDNGCRPARLPLDTLLCTLEQPISLTREQFVAQCIVQLLYWIMGQSPLCEIQFDSLSLT